MKRILTASVGCLMMLAACKEDHPPLVDLGGESAAATDTTYVGSVETPQQRRVLMEEFTGASCSPCPGGHAKILQLESQYKDSFAAVGYSPFGFPQTEPVTGLSKYDFRTQTASDMKTMFSVTAIPVGVIDRLPGQAGYPQDVTAWAASVKNRVSVPTNLNLTLSSQYDAGSNTSQVTVRASYTGSVAKKQVLYLLLLENNIIDAQKDGLDIDTFYTHRHVFRKMYTLSAGSPVLDSVATKGPGRVYERHFTIDIDPAWNPDNCKLLAWISNNEGSDKEVQQSAEVDLK